MEAAFESQSTDGGRNLSGARSAASGPAAGSAGCPGGGPADAAHGLLRRALPALLALAAGLALRLWMLKNFFQVDVDELIYGGLAKNLLLHGQYALNGSHGELYPTLIRLPGYPLFLALCFRLFGMENYASAAWVQIGLELAGCLLLADFAGRIAPVTQQSGVGGRRRVALATLWLAALCPFTAIYAAEPLTEALSLFMVALALWSAARFLEHPAWPSALWFTFAVGFAALLRPDGALVGVALAPALAMGLWRKMKKREAGQEFCGERSSKLPEVSGHDFSRAIEAPQSDAALAAEEYHVIENTSPQGLKPNSIFVPLAARLKSCPDTNQGISADCEARTESDDLEAPACPPRKKGFRLLRMAVVCALLALAPFAAWSWRNWRVFHVFEPLAPRYANDPGEDMHAGWIRWVRTWCLDFVSTYDIYWNVPEGTLDLSKLPERAYDSPDEYTQTVQLAEAYIRNGQEISPQLDTRFEQLAEQRIAAHPVRYYLWLPLGRLADMWLRPRVENLPIDLDWWVYAHHRAETVFSWGYAGLNALYLLLALAGLWMKPRLWPWMLAYLLLRSALLATIEAPEARYTLECFPILFVLGGIAVSGALHRLAVLRRQRRALPH